MSKRGRCQSLGQWQWTRRSVWQCREIQWGKGGAKRVMRLLRARGLAVLKNVTSGPAMEDFRMENRKVEFQVIGKDQSRLPERGTIGEVRRGKRGGRRASHRTKEKVHRFRIRFKREREEQVAYHASTLALAMTDEACREEEM